MKRSGPMLPAPNADVAAACGSIVLPRCRRCEGSLQGRVTGLAGRFSFGGAAISSGCLLEPARALLEVAAPFEPATATCSRPARFAGIGLVAPLAVD